jgi:hypothetical protein
LTGVRLSRCVGLRLCNGRHGLDRASGEFIEKSVDPMPARLDYGLR